MQRLLLLGDAVVLPAHRSRSIWSAVLQAWEEMQGFYEELLILKNRGRLMVSLTLSLKPFLPQKLDASCRASSFTTPRSTEVG
jgi:hypothetical protein